MPLYDVAGARYNVEQRGDGPPLLLLHGFTGSGRSWETVLADLSAHYRVLTIDLPGHGDTVMPDEPDRFTMQSVAADIDLLLHEIGYPEVLLLGYSMGGRLALYLAHHYPQRFPVLVLESTSPGLRTREEQEKRIASDENLAAYIESSGILPFVDYWEQIPLFATQYGRVVPEERRRLRQQRLENHPAGLASSLRGMGTGIQPSLWPVLGTIDQPALLIAGHEDVKFAAIARDMAGMMPNAMLALIPNAGHAVHLEQPQAYAGQVLGWLDNQRRNQLAHTEQNNERQSGQRHLLEPRVEGGQLVRSTNGNTIASKQGHSQEEEQIPSRRKGQRDVHESEDDGACQE